MDEDIKFYDIPLNELEKDPVLRKRLMNLVDNLKKVFDKDKNRAKLPGENHA